jgi:KUP system potassium uptake protein
MTLTLGALGVVFGDIGTSTLYAMRETFESHHHHVELDEANVFGVLSLITWSLIVVITIKYLAFVMRANNDGEGGILALTSLAVPEHGKLVTGRRVLVLIGLFGTALLYGDGTITPAISVLSAVEGATIASPAIGDWVIPIAVVILIGLFAVQPRGTGKIGAVFGPIMVAWFSVLAVLGIAQIVKSPSILGALNPVHAVGFLRHNTFQGFLALGAIFLVVTGGEALYADMGHFGRRPIQLGWFVFVFPALLLNYFGQGALLLSDPSAIDNPFYRMAPSWALLPLLVLATAATVIASQALISGAFSLTMQAVQLGYSPRVHILHTSETASGQIYVPAINWSLMIACIGLVVGFRSSSNLASAYGVAVTLTMVITTILFYVVAREKLGISTKIVAPLCGVFLFIEMGFLGANLFKIPSGGWFPLVMGAIVFTMLTTWFTGRLLVADRLAHHRVPLTEFIDELAAVPPTAIAGVAVYLYRSPGFTPPALQANYRHSHAMHETTIILSVLTADVPHVPGDQQVDVSELAPGFFQVTGTFGFLAAPLVPEMLEGHLFDGREIDLSTITYFVGREALRVTERPGMAMWRERLFAFMSRNATPASTYFCLPDEETIEIGLPVEL